MKKKKKFSFVWLFPTLALLVGFYLAYDKYAQYGATIEIRFPNAEGLEVGKTKIRYKNLDIGTVTNVQLASGLDAVIVTAQMDKRANNLLRADSEFWIVKPQISAKGVVGLSTLLSGSYIAVAAGRSPEPSRHFTALAEIPLVERGEPGLRLRLATEKLGGLNVGSPIYYQGMTVGQVEKINFDDNFEHIIISAFIRAPYDRLVNGNSRFWNVSGFKASLGSTGAKFEMESVESLMMGGITFQTPTGLSSATPTPPAPDQLFTLYKNENDSRSNSQQRKEYYVAYFPNSVRGLKVGAPVNFMGIDIGEVAEIRLLYDRQQKEARVPVLLTLEPDRIGSADGAGDTVPDLIRFGLGASLETGNLLTGEKYVKLAMGSKLQPLRQDEHSAYNLMPTRDTEISQLTDDLSEIVRTVKQLPLKEIGANVATITRDLKGVSANLNRELQSTLKQVNGLVKTLEQTVASGDRSLQKTVEALNRTIAQLEKVLAGLTPSSSLYFSLEKTLQTLEQTGRQIEALVRKVNAKPNSLIFGE